MITSKIAANQAFIQVNKIFKGDDAARQGTGQDGSIKTGQGENIDGIKAEISTFSANPLHNFNAEFNAVVKSIRIADKAMTDIEANVEQMESEVEMFLKQYPPYPPGSEDRVKYLSRFAMLRKQIDQLTIPPNAGAKYIIGSSDTNQAKDWEIEIGGQKTGQIIRRQPVHTGQEGLALPDLSVDSSDQQVAAMREALSEARHTIKERRSQLAEDAIRVIQSAEKIM
jgi:archaellum component FlaC